MEIDVVVINPTSHAFTEIENTISLLSSNPVKKGEFMRIKTNEREVKQITIFDMTGNAKSLSFTKIDNNTTQFQIGDNFKDGIYTLNILNKDNSVSSKNIIIN